MTSISVLLIVTTLVGSPIARIVCLGACEDRPMRPARCHQHMTVPVAPNLEQAENCGAALSQSPFVKEESAPATASLVVSMPVTGMPPTTAVDESANTVPQVIGWCTPGLVLRL